MESKKHKLALISYYFPPVPAVGCVRNYNIAQKLSSVYNTKIITRSYPVDSESSFDIASLDVTRVYTLDEYFFKQKRKGNKKSSGTSIPSFLSRLTNSFPINFFLWEGGLFYILGALVRLFRFRPAIVYSSYSPFSDHYIAFLYKSFFPKTIWIADFRDLHIDPEVDNVILKKWQKGFDKTILKKANFIITVSKGLKEHLLSYNKKVMVVRNGLSDKLKEVSLSESIEEKLRNKFILTYTGLTYNGRRDPSLLFRALHQIIIENPKYNDKIRLVYAGSEGDVWQEIAQVEKVKDFVIDLKRIPYQSSLALQRYSHCNILLSWATKKQKGILTGKFYEYLQANKPIILLINGVKDQEFEEIMFELNAGIVGYDDKDLKKLKTFLLKLLHQWETKGNTQSNIDPNTLNKYRWDSLIISLNDAILQELKK